MDYCEKSLLFFVPNIKLPLILLLLQLIYISMFCLYRLSIRYNKTSLRNDKTILCPETSCFVIFFCCAIYIVYTYNNIYLFLFFVTKKNIVMLRFSMPLLLKEK